MKIALIANNLWRIPPKSGNATQLIVGQLTEGLVRKGHEVTLYAAGDSKTSAKLVSVIPRCVNFDPRKKIRWDRSYDYTLISKLGREAEKYDLIHSHLGTEMAYFTPLIKTPVVTTLHDPLDCSPQDRILPLFAQTQDYVSISGNQREPMPDLNYIATVYHGTNTKSFKFSRPKGRYLAFLGRISQAKGTDIAVRVARRANERLIIAGIIHRSERHIRFWFDRIEPALKDKNISYVGPLLHRRAPDFLGGAKALIFPTRSVWREPFGLVMIEAMACGTPVIAFDYGSPPEIVIHGKTGFLVKTEEEMIKAVGKTDQISREDCRKHVEKNFTVERMVADYEKVYKKILQKGKT